MNNLLNLSEEEKNIIRELHITESKDSRISSVLNEALEDESLADQFYAVTIGQWGTDEDAVYKILDKLETTEDFNAFNKELASTYHMDFYDIACDRTSWTWITEIGGGDETINTHLRRLGVKPIKCYILK